MCSPRGASADAVLISAVHPAFNYELFGCVRVTALVQTVKDVSLAEISSSSLEQSILLIVLNSQLEEYNSANGLSQHYLVKKMKFFHVIF